MTFWKLNISVIRQQGLKILSHSDPLDTASLDPWVTVGF